MIRAWCYRGAEPRESIEVDDVGRHALETDCLLWVDCESPEPDDIASLTAMLRIHDLTAEDLISGHQRTKLERFGDHYHVALQDCVIAVEGLVTREVDVVFGEGWLLTVRHPGGDLEPVSIDDAMRRFERQRGEHGSNDEGFLLWALLDTIVDRYFKVTDAVDERLDDIEDIVFEDTSDSIPRELFALRRSLVSFRRAVGPLREVVSELLRREVECISDQAIVHMQDVYDHVLRMLDLLESQRELLSGLLEAQLAVMSNRMNQVMKATSSWGAILIVGTLVAGIYGMNFRHMPELDWQLGYPMALGSMVLITGILYSVFKRRGWL